MSKTNYNEIAEEYRESKLQPWRAYVEQFTLMKLAGAVDDKTVIDLACGEGHYTRLLRRAGALVNGVDLSESMIELARTQEKHAPLGIKYRVQNVRELGYENTDENKYDLVFAAWLLNYAKTAAELSEMCNAIARLLKPGGRMVAINTNPNDPPDNFTTDKGYGFFKRIKGELVEGAEVIWTVLLDDKKTIEIVNYHLTSNTVEQCMHAAGLEHVRWHGPQLDPAALKENDQAYWQPLLDKPSFVFIECRKTE